MQKKSARPSIPDENFLTVKDVANILRIGPSTAYKLVRTLHRTGKLRLVPLSNGPKPRLRIPRDPFLEWANLKG